MKFPELKIIDTIQNDMEHTDEKELVVIELDWIDIDNHRIENRKDWYLKYGLGPEVGQEQNLALKEILEEVNWSEILYTIKYVDILKEYSYIKMPKQYYDECQYLKEMAIEEWDRIRIKPFETTVREKLLEVAIKYIDLFFYMITDAAYMYNKKTTDHFFECSILLRSLMLYRFWKFQTGGGLIIDKSTDFMKGYTDDVKEKFKLIKEDLIQNVKLEPFGLSRFYPEREEELLKIVNQRVRDNKLKSILKDNELEM